VRVKILFGLVACALLAAPASAQLSTGQKVTSDADKR
jgi:hypothetical protein